MTTYKLEKYLGLPAGDGYILSSTVGGTRSWVPNSSSSGLINISDPDPTGQEGLLTINSSSNIMKVYYQGAWRNLHTLVVATGSYLTEDGFYYLMEDGSSKYLLE